MGGKSITNNIVWRLLERFGAQGVTFIVSIVLARILDPNIYGTIAIVTVITSILQVFIDSGFGTALVQKKDSDNIDFSTVFYFNIVFCLIIYGALFFFAPYIAVFYDKQELTSIIRVLGLTLLISSVKGVQQSYISKTMQFKRFFFATLGGTITAAIIGIWMAYKGFGVWALVAQYLINNLIDTIILWITVKWRPSLTFSFDRLKGLFSYGYKIFLSNLIDTFYQDARQLLIGKMYSSDDLAFYNKGNSFPHLIMNNVSASVDSVLFPALARHQDEKRILRDITIKAIKTGTFVLFPCLFGLAAIANNFVVVFLTEKWLPCVPYIWIFCAMYLLYPLFYPNLNLLKAVGESKKYLFCEILRKSVGIGVLLTTIWFGPIVIAIGAALVSLICLFINLYPSKRIIDLGILSQLKVVAPNFILSLFMFVVVLFIGYFPINKTILLVIQILAGFSIYVLGSKIFKYDSLIYITDVIKHKLRRHKND